MVTWAEFEEAAPGLAAEGERLFRRGEVDESYHLFEFGVDSALLGVRDGPDEWPPRYTSWAEEGTNP